MRPGVPLGQFRRQLDALRLAAGQRGRRLAEVEVAEPDVVEQRELLGDARLGREEVHRVRHGEVEHVGDALPLVADLERLAVVAPPLADLARHVDVGEEVHLDLDEPVALARLAAPALHVEGEAPGAVAAHLRLGQLGEELADRREEPRVGRRVRARRAPDRRLVDVDHLVELIEPLDAVVRARAAPWPDRSGARASGSRMSVDQRRLARAGDAGDRDEAARAGCRR